MMTIVTRIAVNGAHGVVVLQGLEAHRYRNVFHCAYVIAKNEGAFA